MNLFFSLMDEIHELIIENKDTYENQEILEEIENESKLKKRSNEEQPLTVYDNSEFVHVVTSVDDLLILSAYLSKPLVEEIKTKKYIEDVVPSVKGKVCGDHYNEDDILNETYWSSFTAQEQSNLHLSLLSQGIYRKDLINMYDDTYYYPSSAGEGIDIYIIDTSFNFDYHEFNNTDVREAKCIAHVYGKSSEIVPQNSTYCGNLKQDHGQMVADVAGGLIHGAAKNANIYGISVPVDGDFVFIEDVLVSLLYIIDIYRPHKTIVNVSHRFLLGEISFLKDVYKKLVDKLTDGGAIVVTGAGNDRNDVNNNVIEDEEEDPEGTLTVPCIFENTICVGGIDSRQPNNLEKNYYKANSSNYGKNVDLYAPFSIHTEYLRSNGQLIRCAESGTSFSSPLTAGVLATIMSEFDGTEFTKQIALDYLIRNALPFYFNDEVHYMLNNGKHIVYSKDGYYNGCGISAGNRSCEDSCEPDSCNLFKSKRYDCNSMDGEFIYNKNYIETDNLEYACLITVPNDKRISIYNTAWNLYNNQIKAAYNTCTIYEECDPSSEKFDSNICFQKIENIYFYDNFYLDIEYYRIECERRNGVFLTDDKNDYICLTNYIGDDFTDSRYCIVAGFSSTDVYLKKVLCVNDYYTNYNICNQTFSTGRNDETDCLIKAVTMNTRLGILKYVELYNKNDLTDL